MYLISNLTKLFLHNFKKLLNRSVKMIEEIPKIHLSAYLRVGIIYQFYMAHFRPEWMIHPLLGWNSGIMLGALSIVLTAYMTQQVGIIVSSTIQTFRNFLAKRRVKKNSAEPIQSRALEGVFKPR